MHDLDLNLLPVLAALFRTQNVTRAAVELGLSQSAVSHALARLREQLGDPLFVRVSRGVTPTPFAAGLRAEVDELTRRLEALGRQRPTFDPAVATGRITVATTDYVELVVVPRLLPVLRREAPGVTLALTATGSALSVADLERGAVDLAVAGFYEDVPEGFYASTLFTDGFCTAIPFTARADPDPPGVDEFFAARHAVITIRGDFEDRFATAGRGRTFAYGSPSFAALPWVLADTDLWLTAPGRLLDHFARILPIRVHPCPVDAGPIVVRAVWHDRIHRDPLHAWFRRRLREVVDGRPPDGS